MNESKELLKEIEYVKRSGYKTKVLKSLEKGVKIPSGIAKDTEILTNHISVVLKQLKDYELVECINPEVSKGRLYRLTDKGRKVLDELD